MAFNMDKKDALVVGDNTIGVRSNAYCKKKGCNTCEHKTCNDLTDMRPQGQEPTSQSMLLTRRM